MPKLFTRIILIGLVGVMIPVTGLAQVSASGSATTSGPVRATVGTFVFPQGSGLALELTQTTPCLCMCGEILVQGLEVRDQAGNAVYTEAVAPAVPYGDWTGMWDFSRTDGTPVQPGNYTVVVRTSIGEFRAEIEVVRRGEGNLSGRVCASASVCGLGLDVYRLITPEDTGRVVHLRAGEKVMIALPGNPTTGYEWTGPDAVSTGVLEPIYGESYRPESTLLGAGGTFFFRYVAVGAGRAELSFSYRRPWEKEPADQFSVIISVGGV